MIAIRPMFCLGVLMLGMSGGALAESRSLNLADLGRMLFFDARLSVERNQACASCHDPERAFSDPGTGTTAGAVSVGSNGSALGDRNAPSLSYVSRIPPFHRDVNGNYVGGLFLDGRAATLVDQAREPVTNPIEMALADAVMVRHRLLEDDTYARAFEDVLGPAALGTPDKAVESVALALSAFEKSDSFASFDSRYDRYLRGEEELTDDEEMGRALFFSDLVNCTHCHLLDRREDQPQEIFTNLRYHNIGVPANAGARLQNGLGEHHVDRGLLDNPAVIDAAQSGRFRVPSLRNVAVTGPYMHNGVFRNLETTIIFYNRFLLSSAETRINPETGEPWRKPEVPETIDLELLKKGQPLTAERVSQLVAFLRTLTDRRYEHLLRK